MTLHTHTGRLALALLVLIATIGAVAGASGVREDDHHAEDHHAEEHHGEDHDGEQMIIPAIDPVDLTTGERLRVVVSTSIIGDVVGRVAGDTVQLTTLIPIGQNPHAYQPTPRVMGAVERAHIVFVNGLNFEEGLMDAVSRVATGYVVPVSAGITVLADNDDHDDDYDDDHHDDDHDDDHDDHAGGDPHFWMAPTNVIVWTENIAHVLSDADPRNRDTYRSNADAYIADLRSLDREIRAGVSSIPAEDRKLVMDHVALTYFAAEYGFDIIGEVIPAVSDQAEPSARHIAELTGLVRDENVRAIFVGGTASQGLRNLVQAVADETGRDIGLVEILTGSLAATGNRGDTYLDFARYNAEQILNALTR